MITQPFNMLPPGMRFAYPGPGNTLLVDKEWYRFLTNVYNAVTQGLPFPEQSVTVGASPYSYTADQRGQLLVSGGTVTLVEYSRNGTDFYDTGQTAGLFQLDQDDILRITHGGAPDAVFFPL